MEHEVFVPLAEESLREVLGDPARLAPCVPGLQQDADASAGPLSGRLRVRAGGHSITYRGALRVAAADDGSYTAEGDGEEVRGTGTARLALTVRLTAVEGGTTLHFAGAVTADGRLAELPDDAAVSAAHRLLDRFAESLTEVASASRDDGDAADARGKADEGGQPEEGSGARRGSVFDVPVPPSSLDPRADGPAGDGPAGDEVEGDDMGGDEPDDGDEADDPLSVDQPVEAAHARRTMIGRSAEEVDHAPPRGRYAPLPGPEAATASGALRWLVPAAAAAVASAVVIGRALRRRR
ncbi:SRPBCC domain-containing protein [Streptomyces sp. ODS05-4]|uniref:SRPBCC domain-containing protein n=1 Tax=Streptomyces sp. ODS05-4 TaxID=2944939 RepID=UPI00210D6A8C|nr:SRPBCC domain-containing protein [Streptomyces sp. ODS05-4]